MASSALDSGPIAWSHNRGRNGWDSPKDVLQDQVAESINVILQRGTLGIKRQGSADQPITGTFSGFNALARFVPGQNDAAAELHFIDRSTPAKFLRVAGGNAAAELTLVDYLTTRPQDAHSAILNGKLYWAYDSDADRLHVYDPSTSTTSVRRVGLAVPAAPTVGNVGTGAYPATTRRYKIAFRSKLGTDLRRQSELSPETIVTPNGGSLAMRVFKPANINEGETHWVVYGATATVSVWYELAELPIGTGFYDDTELPSTYNTNDAEPVVGTYSLWPSVRFLLSTGDRLVGFGAHEATSLNGRVFFSSVLGATDTDDEERVSNIIDGFRGYLDVARNAGSEDRGLIGPLDGQILVGQSRGIYLLVGTGDPEQPFRRITLSPIIGMVNQHSAFMGEDENGSPCAYWLDETRGPMRYGRKGIEWCGYDVKDIWNTVNLSATVKVAHGQYHPDLKACIWWIATGTANEPNEMIVLFTREGQSTPEDGVRYGWVRWWGGLASARCSVMFGTIGAPMGRRLFPYGGFAPSLLRALDPATAMDGATPYEAYVTSRAFAGQNVFTGKTLGLSYVLAPTTLSLVEIFQTLIRNFGQDEGVSSASLEPKTIEHRGLRKFEDAEMTDAGVFQIKLGDPFPIANHWQIDEWFASVEQTDQEG